MIVQLPRVTQIQTQIVLDIVEILLKSSEQPCGTLLLSH